MACRRVSMLELIQVILDFLKLIPTQAALVLIIGLIGLLFKGQKKIGDALDKHTAEEELRFASIEDRLSVLEKRFVDVEEHFLRVHEEVLDVHRMVLKETVYNDSMDFFERQEAYDEYIALGGNGFTKRYYENILRPQIEEHIKEGNKR